MDLDSLLTSLNSFSFELKFAEQGEVIEHIYKREARDLGGLLVLGCGFGKTWMAIATILLVERKTLWITKPSLKVQAFNDIRKCLDAKQQESRIVMLDKDPAVLNSLRPDSICIVPYTSLNKWKDRLVDAAFERVIADESQANKDGRNSFSVVEEVSASAITCWGLSGTLYNNRWRDLLNPLAWVTKNPQLKDCTDEADIQQLVVPKAPDGTLLPPEWYLKKEVPKEALGFEQIPRLVVLPFQFPEEVVMSRSALCRFPDKKYSNRLAAGSYNMMLQHQIDTSQPSATKRRMINRPVHDNIHAWAEKRQVAPLMSAGAMAAAYATASGLCEEEAKKQLGSELHVPTKAFFVINHANFMHPNSPVVVLYHEVPLATIMARQFLVHPVYGAHGHSRPVFHWLNLDNKPCTVPKQKVVTDFMATAAAWAQTPDNDAPPPVLLAQSSVISEGVDGLQKVCNVMYQTTLSDNPQQDVQAAQRIFRMGQTQSKVYLYRIMVDSYAEKIKLQRQVSKAGGYRQRVYNVDNACEILDIPESWEVDEPGDDAEESGAADEPGG